jgi:hypothetical protein
VNDEITVQRRDNFAERPVYRRLTLEGWAYSIVGIGGLVLLVLAGRC